MKWQIILLLLISVSCVNDEKPEITLTDQNVDSGSLFIGLHVLDENVVWASGTQSTIIRTLNGGETWSSYLFREVDSLQFRDIHGISANEAVVLSIGSGPSSQIFKFSIKNGWNQVFKMDHPDGFLDAFDFWRNGYGIAFGDSFDGKPYILITEDEGNSWSRIDPDLLPEAGAGEGGFAASGTCVEMGPDGKAWIGTGAGGNARVLFTSDYGKTWTANLTPMIKGEAAGITSVRFVKNYGIIVGGDLAIPDDYADNLFISENEGRSWSPMNQPITTGAFYGSAFIPFRGSFLVVICSPKGADISFNTGQTWENVSDENLWTVDLLPSGIGWVMGADGKIMKLKIGD